MSWAEQWVSSRVFLQPLTGLRRLAFPVLAQVSAVKASGLAQRIPGSREDLRMGLACLAGPLPSGVPAPPVRPVGLQTAVPAQPRL